MKTIEEILARMQVIDDAADLSPELMNEYEGLETELQTAQRASQIHARQAAYNTPVGPSHYHVAPAKVDDALDKAFEAYLRTGQPNQDISGLRNAQGEGSGSTGGYMVPSGFRQKMVEAMKAFGGLAQHVDTITTDTGGPLEYPSLDDTANSGGITAESAAITSGADLVFGTVALGAYKYTSAGAGSNLALRVPVELLQDAAFDVAGLVSRKLGERIARAQAAHWTTGAGSGSSQPLGLVASSLVADNELDTPDTIDYDDILDTYDLLDPAYEQNARWLMKKNTWSQIRAVVDVNGRPIVQDATAGIGGATPPMLLGFPVVIDQGMPTLSSAADGFCIAFGDFREAYVIRRVSNLTVIVNPYSRATNGEVEFTAWERADGNIQNRAAYVICSNNT